MCHSSARPPSIRSAASAESTTTRLASLRVENDATSPPPARASASRRDRKNHAPPPGDATDPPRTTQCSCDRAGSGDTTVTAGGDGMYATSPLTIAPRENDEPPQTRAAASEVSKPAHSPATTAHPLADASAAAARYIAVPTPKPCR